MKILCCNYFQSNINRLDEIESISNIVIALLTLALAFYVFIYQRQKDVNSKLEAEKQRSKNIKLQWFKEMIVQPKMEVMFIFYEKLHTLKQKLNKAELSDVEKIEILNFIKESQSDFRKNFLDLIQHVNFDLYNKISSNLDNLTDHLTVVISNDEFKFSNSKTYSREIDSKIQISYTEVLSSIFSFEG